MDDQHGPGEPPGRPTSCTSGTIDEAEAMTEPRPPSRPHRFGRQRSADRLHRSGAEERPRGNLQQMIVRYEALAEEAARTGDRVAAQNYLQHAEHYIRLRNSQQRHMHAGTTDQQESRRTEDMDADLATVE